MVTARNGAEAIDVINRERPALVITDILMPKMDGYALVQRIRTDPKLRHIPVVFLSATYITPEDKAFALSLGAVRFLEKPVDTEEFLLTIAEILTGGVSTLPEPMKEEDFYQGYRERLEAKLRHKNTQISRPERLLETLQPEQQPAFQSLLNRAINETLPRSVLTHATTLATLLALALLGGEVIRPFALVMFFGVFTGTFSSIYIAGPLLLYIEQRWPGADARGVKTSAPLAGSTKVQPTV